MNLTSQQQALLDGAKGPAMAKVVKTLVMYGECFGAERMVPVTGANGHLVTSFGLSMLGRPEAPRPRRPGQPAAKAAVQDYVFQTRRL